MQTVGFPQWKLDLRNRIFHADNTKVSLEDLLRRWGVREKTIVTIVASDLKVEHIRSMTPNTVKDTLAGIMKGANSNEIRTLVRKIVTLNNNLDELSSLFKDWKIDSYAYRFNNFAMDLDTFWDLPKPQQKEIMPEMGPYSLLLHKLTNKKRALQPITSAVIMKANRMRRL